MFNNVEQDLSLQDLQVRHSVAVRIGVVLMAFFSAAWCLLQWILTTEPRFVAEGITRQFVMLESFACAAAAAIAFVFMLANVLGWISTTNKIRHEQNRAASKLAVHRVGAFV